MTPAALGPIDPDTARQLVEAGAWVILLLFGGAVIAALFRLALAAWERDRKRADTLAAENAAMRASLDATSEALKGQSDAFVKALDKMSDDFARELEALASEVRWDQRDRLEARQLAAEARRRAEGEARAAGEPVPLDHRSERQARARRRRPAGG